MIAIGRTCYDFKIALKKRIQPIFNNKLYSRFGHGSVIDKPLLVRNKKYISIGENVIIKAGSRIEVVDRYQQNNYNPNLSIDDDVVIEFNLHISCIHRIIIEKGVMIAGNVTIVDNNHGYEDINTPISKQALISNGEVVVGQGSFIGMGARIMSGVTIGKNCVVGANSVVTKSIPDYSVVGGIPAKIIKKYNCEKEVWEKS